MSCHTHTLTLTATHVDQLRDHLLRADGLERCAYAYCSPTADGRLLVEQLVLIPDEDTTTQSRTACRPAQAVELRLVQECLRRGMHPCLIHSHPFDHTGTPRFSAQDEEMMTRFTRFILGHEPNAVPLYAVFSAKGVTAAVYPPALNHEEQEDETPTWKPLPVTVLGNHRLDTRLQNAADTIRPDNTEIDTQRFHRGILMLGEAGQDRLAGTHVVVIGNGGLGDLIATQLAMMGVSHFILVDPDTVEKSNLPRLASAADHHVGRPKVEVTKQMVWRQNPAATVETIQAPIEEAEDALYAANLIVAGVDRVSTRQWLNTFAVRHLKPYIDAGVVITTEETEADHPPRVEVMKGCVQTVLPGVTACYTCLNRGDPEQARIEHLSDDELEEEIERGYIDGTALSPAPAVVPLNGVVASLTVDVVSKLINGHTPPANYLQLDLIANDLNEDPMKPRKTCPTCGPTGVLGRGTRDETAADLDATDYDLDLDTGFARTPATRHVDGDAATVTAAIHTAVTTATGLRARLQNHRTR